jgi:hypothetical protein
LSLICLSIPLNRLIHLLNPSIIFKGKFPNVDVLNGEQCSPWRYSTDGMQYIVLVKYVSASSLAAIATGVPVKSQMHFHNKIKQFLHFIKTKSNFFFFQFINCYILVAHSDCPWRYVTFYEGRAKIITSTAQFKSRL